jgi:hypothetical protein
MLPLWAAISRAPQQRPRKLAPASHSFTRTLAVEAGRR